MRIAAIDLGTNTFHLIIVDKEDQSMTIVYKEQRPIKLGENITLHNRIIPTAFNRGVECLVHFKTILDTHNVQKVKAVATSAVRSADNGREFVQAAQQRAGIHIDIIDGNEEAKLIFDGVKSSGVIAEPSLIMDIGGGSTEFIFCDHQQLIWKRSFEIGGSRLMQKFFKSDPINTLDQKRVREHLALELEDLLHFSNTFPTAHLIGSAGAFETFSQMTNPSFDIENHSHGIIQMDQYIALSQRLTKSKHQQRSMMKNLIPLRVDMIVMACAITDFIIENLHIKKLSFSTYDLKMGLINHLIKS